MQQKRRYLRVPPAERVIPPLALQDKVIGEAALPMNCTPFDGGTSINTEISNLDQCNHLYNANIIFLISLFLYLSLFGY